MLSAKDARYTTPAPGAYSPGCGLINDLFDSPPAALPFARGRARMPRASSAYYRILRKYTRAYVRAT